MRFPHSNQSSDSPSEMTITESLYCSFDILSGTFSNFVMATSDGLAARRILLTLRVPIKDNLLVCLGKITKTLNKNLDTVDLRQFAFENESFRVCDWKSYRFPENVAEALAPLGLTDEELKTISEVKHNG